MNMDSECIYIVIVYLKGFFLLRNVLIDLCNCSMHKNANVE